jgi:SecD/SecF fusion protein
MQARGLIITFVTALIMVCAYQLLFTFSANRVEAAAEAYAKAKVLGENKEMVVPSGLNPTAQAAFIDSVSRELRFTKNVYLDSVSNETALNLGFAKFNYNEVKSKQISLGLDLQGGMSVVLQVSLEDLIKSMANNSQDPTFLKALENAKKRQSESQDNFVAIFGEEFKKLDSGAKLAAIFATPENKDKINFNSTNEQVLAVLKQESAGAVERTFNIIRSRIDEFGVTQPNINLQETTGRIIVELPGVDNAERARNLLQATAQLEFWETWDNQEVFNYFVSANDVLVTVLSTETTESTDTNAVVTTDSTIVAGSDSLSLTETTTTDTSLAATDTSDLNNLLSDSKEGVKDSLTSDAEIEKKFPLFSNGSILMPATGQDENGQFTVMQGPVVGYAFAQNRSKINDYLALEKVRAVFPKNIKFAWGSSPVGTSGNIYALYALKTKPNDDKAALEGDAIVDARQDFDSNGKPDVDMTMNSEGAKIWRRLTKENIGKSVAVVLDNVVYTAPTVQGEIGGGRSQITGNFTVKEAKDLANIIKAGKLPAPAQIVEEEVVGPSLGKESIRAGLFSLALGFGIVVLFMIFYYTSGGVLANLSLFLNMFLIMGVLASFQASLTLPGMAGIVLTIGMAVDANVIIFERIREELSKGKSLRLAVSDGFSNSYSAIIDSNVTSLITGLILLVIGLGPVKGFATVFVIGLFTSFITAVLVSRIFFEWYLSKKERNVSFGTNFSNNLFSNFNFKFVEKRKIAYVISGTLTLVGIASIATRGFDLGVDFEGGRTYVIRFDKEVSANELTASLTKEFGKAPLVRTYGGGNQVKITTAYRISETDMAIDSIVETKVYNGVKSFYNNAPDIDDFKANYRLSSMKVGPTIADDIKSSSLLASLLSLLGIFIYLAIRFRRWEFGVGAIVATVHDVFMIFTLFSLLKGLLPFSTEIDQALIAAVLTIIGYSVNDTVIVFDRVREFLNLHPTKSLTENVNGALNTTLSRTTMTSFTTLLVVLVLFIFGGEAIRGFSFALLVGIVVGTYSSIFIASPIVVDLLARNTKKK